MSTALSRISQSTTYEVRTSNRRSAIYREALTAYFAADILSHSALIRAQLSFGDVKTSTFRSAPTLSDSGSIVVPTDDESQSEVSNHDHSFVRHANRQQTRSRSRALPDSSSWLAVFRCFGRYSMSGPLCRMNRLGLLLASGHSIRRVTASAIAYASSRLRIHARGQSHAPRNLSGLDLILGSGSLYSPSSRPGACPTSLVAAPQWQFSCATLWL